MGRLGLSSSEIDKMIQWRIKPFRQIERELLIKTIRSFTHLTESEMFEESITKYYQSKSTYTKQFTWRILELRVFIYYIFKICPPRLASNPLKFQAGGMKKNFRQSAHKLI